MHSRHAASVVVIAATLAAGLAGCDPGSDELTVVVDGTAAPWPWETSPPSPTPSPTPTPTPTLTPTLTPTPTPTPTPTHTPTPTPTPEPEPPDPPPPPAGDPLPEFEDEVVHLTNLERVQRGCMRLLDVDDRLAAAARGHSADMAARDFFDHVNPDGEDPGDRAEAQGYDRWSGENIAFGQPSPEDVVDEWMDSEGHRKNILNCGSEAIGVGAVDSDRGIYWTQMFGRD